LNQEFYIVIVSCKILGKPIKQVLIPGGFFHFIDGLDRAAAHEALPDAIDERAGEPAIVAFGDDFSELFEASRFIGVGRKVAQFRVDKLEVGLLTSGFVATHHFKRAIGVNAGETVRISERKIVDETVVAGSALEIHTHENLRDILCRLHLRRLAGIDDAAPDDAFGEPFRVRDRIDKFVDELVERHVGLKR